MQINIFCRLKKTAQETAEHERDEVGAQGYGDGDGEFFFLDRSEVHRRHVKDRFARTVRDAGTAGDITVRAVFLKNFRKERGGAAARKRLDQREFSDFLRHADQPKDGREQTLQSVGKPARLKQLT